MSTCTETGQKRSWRGGEVSVEGRLPGKSWKCVTAQHSSDRSQFHSGNKHFYCCLLFIWWTELSSVFFQGNIMMLLFKHLLIHFFSQIIEKSLCLGFILIWWDRFIQFTSTCCSQLLFTDFNTPFKKLPLSGDRWTDWDLDTGQPQVELEASVIQLSSRCWHSPTGCHKSNAKRNQ